MQTLSLPTIGPLPGWQAAPMGFSNNRAQWICSPLVGWALVSGAMSPAWAQTTPASPPVDTMTGTTSQPAATLPGAGGTAPTGTVPGTIVAPTSTTTTQGGATPDNTNQQGIPPGGAPTAGSTTTTQPSSPSAPTTGSDANRLIAPSSFTSSTGQLLYGAAAGASIPTFAGGGGGGQELGMPLGAFTLFPSIEINTGVDSNVFAQNNSSTSTTSSLYTTIVPTLELRSNWLNHELHVALGGGFGFYTNAPTQNYQNYNVTVDGRIDVREDVKVTPSIGYRRATEALGTPNVAFAQSPTVVQTVPVKLSLYQRFNRFFYEISGSATRYWHTDYSTITSSGLPASSRDRFEYGESLRLGYEMTDDVSLYIQPTLNQVRYVNPTNTADQQRDSDNLGVVGGATWIISPVSSIDGNLGFTSRQYNTGGLSGDSEFVGSLSGTLKPYEPLTLRPSFSRSIQETALSNYKNMVLTTLGLDFSYSIHDVWTAVGGVSYSLTDYNPADGTSAIARTDKIFRGQIGFLYALRPQIGIGPMFEYTSGSSTDSTNGPFYDREVISIRLTAKR